MVKKDSDKTYRLNIHTSKSVKPAIDRLEAHERDLSKAPELIGPDNDNSEDFENKIDMLSKSIEESRTGQGSSTSSKALYRDTDYHRINTGIDTNVPENLKPFEKVVYIQSKDVNRIIHSPFLRILSRKTQLFPLSTHSSIRNRLTHSLEVNDVAVRIARTINNEHNFFAAHQINIDIVRCAALAHDIGHPPFGHAGEAVLADLMEDVGGFEGNAQTLRIMTGLERRMTTQGAREGEQFNVNTRGLNLTNRAIASLVKYDQPLDPAQVSGWWSKLIQGLRRPNVSKSKGYYVEEAPIIKRVKESVLEDPSQRLYTIECAIMDTADDIAYSVYDLEDAMIVGRLHPLEIASITDGNMLEIIHEEVNEKLKDLGYEFQLSVKDVKSYLRWIAGKSNIGLAQDYDFSDPFDRSRFVEQCYMESKKIATERTHRRRFCEDRIGEAIGSISVELNEDCPALSTIKLGAACQVETLILKALNYNAVIRSPQIKTSNKKVKEVVTRVFEAIIDGVFDASIPEGLIESELYDLSIDKKKRLACDLLCAMTEDDVMAAYGALVSNRDLSPTQLHTII